MSNGLRTALAFIAVATAVAAVSLFLFRSSTKQELERGPFSADGSCPSFERVYPSCEIEFGSSGLSVLNSFSETFFGEGAFEISEFSVETQSDDIFTIVAQSNRGPLTSEIIADRTVRLGQDQEDGELYRNHQSSYCDAGRIYEHQVVYRENGSITVQDLEYWNDNGRFRFRLFQNRRLTADVVCTK